MNFSFETWWCQKGYKINKKKKLEFLDSILAVAVWPGLHTRLQNCNLCEAMAPKTITKPWLHKGYNRGYRIVTFVKPWLPKQLLSHGFRRLQSRLQNCNLFKAMASKTITKPWLQEVTIEIRYQ